MTDDLLSFDPDLGSDSREYKMRHYSPDRIPEWVPGRLYSAREDCRRGWIEVKGPAPLCLPVCQFDRGDVLILVSRFTYRLSHKYEGTQVLVFLGGRKPLQGDPVRDAVTTLGWLSAPVAAKLLLPAPTWSQDNLEWDEGGTIPTRTPEDEAAPSPSRSGARSPGR